MSDEMIALSRRAVTAPHWRWTPGARWTVTRAPPLEDYAGRIVEGGRRAPDGPGLPDLADPATLGCLLALVREAWGGDFEQVWLEWYPPLSRWGIQGGHAGTRSVLLASGPTEAEALVDALEASPTERGYAATG